MGISGEKMKAAFAQAPKATATATATDVVVCRWP